MQVYSQDYKHVTVDIIILLLDAIFLSLTITKQVSYPHRF